MSISGVNSGIMGSMMIQIKQALGADLNNAFTKANTSSGSPLGATLDFSQPATLLSKLEKLQNEDPQKFKDLMQKVSDTLKDDAESDSNPTESSFLTLLSQKFASVAQSGDLSQLSPTQNTTSKSSASHAAAAGAAKASTTTCVVCGAAIPEGSTVCPKCGMPVQDATSVLNLMNAGKNKIDATLTNVIGQANQANGNPLGDISGLALPDLIKKLSELKESDPDKFKTMMTAISAGLNKASDSAAAADTGYSGIESKILGDLSSKFVNAGETGDLSLLQPPQRPPMNTGPAIALYTSDPSTGSQQSLLDLLTQKADIGSIFGSNSNDALNNVQTILFQALQSKS